MKPIIANMTLFSLDRVDAIRERRVLTLAVGLVTVHKPRAKTKRKPKEIKINAKARAAMAATDDVTRKFLEQMLKRG